ncbi:ubiquitin carboxyl-terminal hydrolase 45-like isoform X3 [Dysidea avara]|uniref:ubiquitin carboxyl-terminal hydrolase 45-like isoform X3 n=1 Tax=Dysidea avara TaxID=196820 RepID=UPI003327DBA2
MSKNKFHKKNQKPGDGKGGKHSEVAKKKGKTGGGSGKKGNKKRNQKMSQGSDVSDMPDAKSMEIAFKETRVALAGQTLWRYFGGATVMGLSVVIFFATVRPFRALSLRHLVVSGIMRVSSLSCRGSKWILTPIWSRIVSPIWTRIWPRRLPTGRRRLSNTPTGSREPCPSDEPPSLRNIGSTCFFNSTLQVILLIKDMLLKTFEKARTGVTHTFHCNEYNEDIVVEITFADKPMTSAFIKFLNAVKKDKGHILTALRNLHSRIAERYQRFSSFDQQDSEEVLRCLLDGIRTEEINATREEIKVVVSKMEKSSDEKENLIKRTQRKAFRITTLVDTVFGGKCINTVICRECLNPLQLEEPFLDLSVPLPDNSTRTSYEISSDEATGSCETEDREEAKNPISVQKLLRDHELITKLIEPTTESPEHSSNDLKHCLTLYTTLDVLDEDNKFICDPCTDRLKKEWRDKKQAAKKNKPPPPSSSSIAVPPSSSTAVPPSPSTAVPPSSSTAVPPSSSTAVPPSPSTAVPPSSSTAVPPSSSTAVPPSPSTAVPPSSSTAVPPSSSTAVPPSPSTAVPPSSSTAVPPSSSTAVPPSPSTAVPPSSSTAVPPSSSTAVPPSSSTAVPPSSSTAVPDTEEGNSPADTTNKSEEEEENSPADTTTKPEEVEENSPADTTNKSEGETSSETAGTSNEEENSPADTTTQPEEETSSETAGTSNEEENSPADTTNKSEGETSSETAGTSNKEPEYAECLVSKQLLIHELPQALILHMKRFLLGIPVRKNNLHIDFPGNLDMAPYCTTNCEVDPGEDRQIMYDLLGVVQHSGSLHGGHYTAYVKYKCYTCSSEHKDDEEGAAGTFANNKPDSGFGGSGYHNYHYRSMEPPGDLESGKILPASGHHWFHTSDSWKEQVTRDDVNGSQAYLLLYVKRHQ